MYAYYSGNSTKLYRSCEIFCRVLMVNKGSRKKTVLLLMARPLRPNLPPPLELNGRWNVGTLKNKGYKKAFFSLMARPFTNPPPLLIARPLREELLRLPLLTLSTF